MHHRLLVPGLVVGHPIYVLLERLAHPRYVAVTEDAKSTGEEALLLPVALHVLVRQKQDKRLGHRQPYSAHTSAHLRFPYRLRFAGDDRRGRVHRGAYVTVRRVQERLSRDEAPHLR